MRGDQALALLEKPFRLAYPRSAALRTGGLPFGWPRKLPLATLLPCGVDPTTIWQRIRGRGCVR